MSTPVDQPQKPIPPVVPPPEGSTTGDAAINTTGSGQTNTLNYLDVLNEGGAIWKQVKAQGSPKPTGKIDLSENPYPVTRASAESQLAGANAFVANFTGSDSRTALNDWIFSDDGNSVKHTKAGDTTIQARNADGLAVTADITKDKITAGGDGWKVEHDPKTGATVYDSTEFRASEKDGVKTIVDKERGTKLQWDSKTHHGVVYDATGKESFEFNSLSKFEEEVKARLTDDRYLHMLNTKHAYDAAVRAHLALHDKNPGMHDAEQIYTDGSGNFSVITKDGLLYQYDKDTKSTYLQKGNVRIRVHDGKAYAVENEGTTGQTHETLIRDFKQYHALGLGTVVGTDGQIKLPDSTHVNNLLGTLTANSDGGQVTVSSANGATTMHTRTGDLTLAQDGSVTNTQPETRILEHYDAKSQTLVGQNKQGGSYVMNAKNLHVTESNGRQADLYSNGAVNVVDAHGKQLFGIDSRGNTSVAGQFVVGANGDVQYHGAHVGSVDSNDQARSTSTATWDDASYEIQGAFGNLNLDNIGVVEGELRDDYNIITDLAARVTAKGNIPVANILNARANSILAAINNLEGQKGQLQNKQGTPAPGTVPGNRTDVGSNGEVSTPIVTASNDPSANVSGTRRIDVPGGMVAGPEIPIRTDGPPGIVSMPEQHRNT
jgi:hypothetical protein